MEKGSACYTSRGAGRQDRTHGISKEMHAGSYSQPIFGFDGSDYMFRFGRSHSQPLKDFKAPQQRHE